LRDLVRSGPLCGPGEKGLKGFLWPGRANAPFGQGS
jgi:hypothetical protein